MSNSVNRRRSARLQSQSVFVSKSEPNPVLPLDKNNEKAADNNGSSRSIVHSYVITPRGGVKRKAVDRPSKNPFPELLVSTPKPTAKPSELVHEVFHDNLVHIKYVQHRNQLTGYTTREVNIEFSDAEDDAETHTGDGSTSGGNGKNKPKRKRTQIVISTVPVN